ncbi:hypothetical protein GXW82_02425 [Streptacidiphilus sp. 4-A2]|nr:hypothetical protein [Streptacidiphilus sp. 4-A2]
MTVPGGTPITGPRCPLLEARRDVRPIAPREAALRTAPCPLCDPPEAEA